MDKPNEIATLSRAYETDILPRILQCPLGWILRNIATPDAALAALPLGLQVFYGT